MQSSQLVSVATLINNSAEVVKAFHAGYLAIKKIAEYFQTYSDEQRRRLNEKSHRLANQEVSIAQINFPTLVSATEGLAYAEFELNLREMFENLIMNTLADSSKIHPSYVEIIKQLSDEDAKAFLVLYAHIIKYKEDYVKYCDYENIAEIDYQPLDDGDGICYENCIRDLVFDKRSHNLTIPNYEKLQEPKMIHHTDPDGGEYGQLEEYGDDINITIAPHIINNLSRLGLIELLPQLKELRSVDGKWLGNMNMDRDEVILAITDFGTSFANAVQLDQI